MTPTQQAAVLAGLEAIRAEVRRATEKHPREYQSAHEAYGILKEEVDELWDAIKEDDLEHARYEATQIGAVIVRFLATDFGATCRHCGHPLADHCGECFQPATTP